MIQERSRKISPTKYTSKYFLNKGNATGFKNFKKGGKPRGIYLKAVKFVPSNLGGPFLDVGCGRGELVVYLARLGSKAYGVDYSTSAIKICRELLKSETPTVKRLAHFRLNDCARLPFKNETFACLFMLDITEHLTPDQLKLALKEGQRVLKNRGVLIIHTNNKYFEKATKLLIAALYHGPKVFLRPKETLAQSADPYEYLHINYLTAGNLADLLKESGFHAGVYYVKPERKTKLAKYLNFNEEWKKWIFNILTWRLLNSPLKKFISPTFWIVATKIN